tara:strand:+ start:489 stop:947 length:459 start_codon:yes stop_codon:yes gene_type:complete
MNNKILTVKDATNKFKDFGKEYGISKQGILIELAKALEDNSEMFEVQMFDVETLDEHKDRQTKWNEIREYLWKELEKTFPKDMYYAALECELEVFIDIGKNGEEVHETDLDGYQQVMEKLQEYPHQEIRISEKTLRTMCIKMMKETLNEINN